MSTKISILLFTSLDKIDVRTAEFQPIVGENCSVNIAATRNSFLAVMERKVPDLIIIDKHEDSEISIAFTIEHVYEIFNLLRLGTNPKIILYNSGGKGGANGLLSIEKPWDALIFTKEARELVKN